MRSNGYVGQGNPVERRAANRATLGLLVAGLGALTSCAQQDDVVAQIAALQDAGPLGGQPAVDGMDGAVADACVLPPIYYPLSWTVRNDCAVPIDPNLRELISGFFAQQPAPSAPGETRPPSTCEFVGGPVVVFFAMPNGDTFLCPSYCELATNYVRNEEQRILDCRDWSMP